MHPVLGEIDHKAGEFWIGSPFLMPKEGANLSAYERNRLYLNLNGTDFMDASFASGADIDADSRSVAVGDFDLDGRPDLLVGSVGGGPLRLFLNRMPQGNRLRLKLRGRDSNRSAIGTRVIATLHDRQVVRDLFPANGCMGTGPVQLSLGVGAAERIDKLWIRWPSGIVQEFTDVPATGQLEIREGEAELVKL